MSEPTLVLEDRLVHLAGRLTDSGWDLSDRDLELLAAALPVVLPIKGES